MSSLYPSRTRDPQPLARGGELFLIAVVASLLGVSIAALAGLGTASGLVGGGWVWPHGSVAAAHVLGGLLAGHPGRGLPPGQALRVPGRVAVYTAVTLAEMAFVATAVIGGMLFARWHRPGDARAGMATRAEAAAVLGVGRLRGAATVIRPDLYPPRRRRDRRDHMIEPGR